MVAVTLSELARRLTVNKSYIHKLKTQGILLFDIHGLIDEDVAKQAIADNRQRQRARDADRAGEGEAESDTDVEKQSGLTLIKAKTMKEAYHAQIARIVFQERSGKLVEAQGVKETIIEAAALIRNALQRIPERIAARVAAEPDVDRCYDLLEREIEQVLDELSNSCESMKQRYGRGGVI